MTLYVKKQLQFRIAQDPAWSDLLFCRGSTQYNIENITELAESQGGQLIIPDGETDLEIPLGPKISLGRFLYLQTDTQITFKLNGTGNQPLDLQPPSLGVPGEFFYDGEFTSLHVTNNSGGTVSLFFVIAGA